VLLIDCAEFVFVGVGVITMDRKDLGNKASARAAVEVHYNVGVRQARGENPARTPLNYIEGKKRQNLTEKMKGFLYGMEGSIAAWGFYDWDWAFRFCSWRKWL